MSDSLPPMTDTELAAFAETAPERIDCELWTLLDWALWGAGLADTLRMPLASTMVAAVPAEVRAQAEMVMAAWLKYRDVESPSRTNAELRQELAAARSECAALAAKYETDLGARRIAEEHLRRDVSEIGDECSALAAKVEAARQGLAENLAEYEQVIASFKPPKTMSREEEEHRDLARAETAEARNCLAIFDAAMGSEMPRPPAQEADAEYMVVIPSLCGNPTDYRMSYSSDRVRKSTREAAIAHGLEVEGHDDWLIAIVVGDKLTGLAWQHEDRDDAEEVEEAAAALGLTAAFAMPIPAAQEPASGPETVWTGSDRGTGVPGAENSAQQSAPWIPWLNGDECPHRPEWTCPEHAECRSCECGCNTYVADLEEPDLTLIPGDMVVRDPDICSGRPTMRGTRILAATIALELAAGTTWEQLREWYPSLPAPGEDR